MRIFLGSWTRVDTSFLKNELNNEITANWIKKENLHLTLHFFGETETEKIKILKEKLDNFRFPNLIFEAKGVSFFGMPPKILFLKIKNSQLKKLHYYLMKHLEIKSHQKFTPHITVARIKEIKDKPKFFKKLKKFKNHSFGIFALEPVLIESFLAPSGAIYKTLLSFSAHFD